MQMIGCHKWSVKQSKCLYVSQPRPPERPLRYRKLRTRSTKPDRKKVAQMRVMQKSNSAQVQQLADSLRCNELEYQKFHTVNETRLQLEAQTLRASQVLDVEHQTLSSACQGEQETQLLRNHTDAQPEHLKEQWKRHVAQVAAYKAEIHALHSESESRMRRRSSPWTSVDQSWKQSLPPGTTCLARATAR